jgi:hypothetical protein
MGLWPIASGREKPRHSRVFPRSGQRLPNDKRLWIALLHLPHGSASPRVMVFRTRNTSRGDKLTLLRQDSASLSRPVGAADAPNNRTIGATGL